jgi:hypothetical protein
MRQHLERFRSGVPAISFVIVLAVVGTACVVDTDRDVAQTGDALYRGTLYSIAPTRSMRRWIRWTAHGLDALNGSKLCGADHLEV